MTPLRSVLLCAAVILMLAAAGCFSAKTTGVSPLVTPQDTATAQPAAAGFAPATQPAGAGTQAPAGTCAADTTSDPANCGGCGFACPANAVCQQGQCYCAQGYTVSNNECVPGSGTGTGTGPDAGTGNGCPAGMSPCVDGYCYDLASDGSNCGLCGNACPAGMACSASTCTSTGPGGSPTGTTTVPTTPTTSSGGSGGSGGLHVLGPEAVSVNALCGISGGTICSGACVNTSTDSANCGSCGTTCTGPLMGCCNGVCQSYATDAANCGGCGIHCTYLQICTSGSCIAKSYINPHITVVGPTYAKVNPKIIVPIGP